MEHTQTKQKSVSGHNQVQNPREVGQSFDSNSEWKLSKGVHPTGQTLAHYTCMRMWTEKGAREDVEA